MLLYEEVDYFLTMNSAHTEAVLTALHRNIHVIRHRSRFSSNTSWSHHEKAVVVDQRVAFIGGLDLALMRYDDHEHRLDDCGAGERRTWPGKDYANPRCGTGCWCADGLALAPRPPNADVCVCAQCQGLH